MAQEALGGLRAGCVVGRPDWEAVPGDPSLAVSIGLFLESLPS